MDYVSLFDAVPWLPVARSAVQTFTIYIFVLLGLKLVGRRVFGERTPQDLVTLFLIAEACDLGLSDQDAGYWGTIASVIVILFMCWLCERVGPLRRLIEDKAVTLYRNGRLDRRALEKNMIDESDLDSIAREYGLASYKEFDVIVLEGDGAITGTLRKSHRPKRQF